MNVTTFAVFVFLITANALYVAAEFAAVGVRRSQIQKLAENGHWLAKGLLPIIEDTARLDRYIAASQIGITLSSLILGAYGQATLGQELALLLALFGDMEPLAAQSTAAMVVLVLLTGLQVVFGELVPKSLALQYPVQLALYTYLPMRWSLKLYSGFIAFLNGSGIVLLRALGVRHSRHRHVHSPEEIDMLIAESREVGLLKLHEQQRLHQALYLSRRTARQLMVPRRFVAIVDTKTPPQQLFQIVVESPFSSLPVYQGSLDNIIGMIHTKDVTAHFAEHRALPTVAQAMRPAISVLDKVTGDRLLAIMRQRHSRKLIVVDEYGTMQGLVTLDDMLIALTGGVAEESKEEYAQPEYLPDGRVRLPGLLRVEETVLWTGLPWHSQANTVAGHITSMLERIPEPGERVMIDGLEVEIEELDGPAIRSVLVKANPPVESPTPENED
ncbi:hemolysin family protein [Nitrosococcus halophilus]|nr:hemolysin family protein [Nitrosococcus halophilus]